MGHQAERRTGIIPKKAEILGSVALAAATVAAWGCGSSSNKIKEIPTTQVNVGGGTLSDKSGAEKSGPGTNNNPETKGIDFSIKDSSGRTVDISEDARFANKPVLVFYYGRTFGPSDSALEIVEKIKAEHPSLAIMPVILDNDKRLIQLLGPLGEVFVDESNVQSEASIALGVQSFPATEVLDGEHKILFKKEGALNGVDLAQVRDTLDVLEKR